MVLRVVGPPGSGKTLLIVWLAEALRSRGWRVATVVRRREGATVVTLSNGARVTIKQPLTLARLRAIASSIDPSIAIILAEGYDMDDDLAFPAIALAPRGTSLNQRIGNVTAVMTTEEIETLFAGGGPGTIGAGESNRLIAFVERCLIEPPPPDAMAAGGVSRTSPDRWRTGWTKGWRRVLGWLWRQ